MRRRLVLVFAAGCGRAAGCRLRAAGALGLDCLSEHGGQGAVVTRYFRHLLGRVALRGFHAGSIDVRASARLS